MLCKVCWIKTIGIMHTYAMSNQVQDITAENLDTQTNSLDDIVSYSLSRDSTG